MIKDLPGVTREPLKPMREMGVPGFAVISGYVQTKERNPRLIGEEKYITASNILANVSIVAAGMTYFLNLVASPEWTVEPVDDSREAVEAAEFVTSCMYDMETSWHRIIRRAGMYRFYGFDVQEWIAKRRADGRIGFRNIEKRPQFTIERWDVDEKSRVRGMWQRSQQTFQEVYLPRAKTIYLVDDTFSDSPEGFGLLRNLAEPADRYLDYQRIEGQGFERDFRGIPVGYAPRMEIMEAADRGELSAAEANSLLSGLDAMVRAQARGEATGLMLDSSTYMGQTAEGGITPSSVRKWGLELLTGSSNGIEHVGAAIEREAYNMAMILGVENLLIGKNSGNRALSEDKSRNLYLTVNSCVKDIAEGIEKDFIGPLWRMNAFDDRLKPSFKVEDVSFRSVEEVTGALERLARAGAQTMPDDPVVNDVRDMLGVSRQPEPGEDYKGV